ncbi:unnamed protein product [Lactuca virosa]|uniref:Pentatricopeptide repeat-containing protein n=1 Tax=Lactuca virosa TaxID=75947 RepID=A0AAU9NAM9_9ASTR|nr:unnamed protein product [Lactuca virosa]
MLKKGEDLDSLTFICVLNYCENLGLMEEGYCYLYEFMEQKCVKPVLVHYLCIISILIRVARLRKALSIIASIPLKWHASALVGLINGCQEHQNSSLFKRIEELIPYDMTLKVSKCLRVKKFHQLLKLTTPTEGGVYMLDIKNCSCAIVVDV